VFLDTADPRSSGSVLLRIAVVLDMAIEDDAGGKVPALRERPLLMFGPAAGLAHVSLKEAGSRHGSRA
jgi:hypothetical protein